MAVEVLQSNQFKTTHWGGGSTTEFYIYPRSSNYADRNFIFRLSAATVEQVSSIFTPLPDVQRQLMVLDGQMTLNHKGHHEKTLNKFDVDHFSGGWETSSSGKCSDFNLMTKEGCKGELVGIHLDRSEPLDLSSVHSADLVFVYLLKGRLSCTNSGVVTQIEPHELLVISEEQIGQLSLCAENYSELVMVIVHLDNEE